MSRFPDFIVQTQNTPTARFIWLNLVNRRGFIRIRWNLLKILDRHFFQRNACQGASIARCHTFLCKNWHLKFGVPSFHDFATDSYTTLPHYQTRNDKVIYTGGSFFT